MYPLGGTPAFITSEPDVGRRILRHAQGLIAAGKALSPGTRLTLLRDSVSPW